MQLARGGGIVISVRWLLHDDLPSGCAIFVFGKNTRQVGKAEFDISRPRINDNKCLSVEHLHHHFLTVNSMLPFFKCWFSVSYKANAYYVQPSYNW